jgi:hypothetical protein
MFFVNLTILANLEAQMPLVVKRLPIENGFGTAGSRNYSLRRMFFVNLTILANLEAQMPLVVKRLPIENGFGTEGSRNYSLRREEIEESNSVSYDVDRQKLRNPFAVSGGSATLLYDADATFDFRDMLIGARQI